MGRLVPVLDDIRELLERHGAPFRELHHEPTRTSEESARVRGEDLSIGAKALLIKVDDQFRLFVLSAALKADSKAIRAHFGARRTRFATAEEMLEMTGLVPGSLPPFGRPILPFELYVDPSVATGDQMAFNAGSLEDSIFLATADYLRIVEPEVFQFAC
jgi:prolyl-tRNA editing enzyme YbaK/EbsC (Cys-tRNA(Pro) deacylase)